MRYRLLCIIILFPAFLNAQNKLHEDFIGSWITSGFYDCIVSNKTPYECSRKGGVTFIYFINNTDSMFIGALTDGCVHQFTAVNQDTVLIYYPGEKSRFYILTISNDRSRLIFNDNEMKLLDKKKYNFNNGSTRFINDQCISGTYNLSTDSTIKITFFTDGKVEGFQNYDSYYLMSYPVDTPLFNTIIFYKKQKYQQMYHWKKFNDDIFLYNYIEVDNDERTLYDNKISDKYVEMIKVK